MERRQRSRSPSRSAAHRPPHSSSSTHDRHPRRRNGSSRRSFSPPHHSRRRRRSRSRSPRSPPNNHRKGNLKDMGENAHHTAAAAAIAVLPAAAHRDELLQALRDHQIVICVGETGSGKTTQIPQYLLAALKNNELGTTTSTPTTTASTTATSSGARVVITQPRRVAAISVAHRVAEEMGFSRVGTGDSPVGYSIRFDDRTCASTRLKFVTDGVLVRECLSDPLLEQYAVVMLDEAHERSLHTDILIGLLKQVLQKRPDLKLLVTSATLDADRFAAFFTKTDEGQEKPAAPKGKRKAQQVATAAPPPIVRIPGRSFPVEIFHSKQMQIMGLRGPLSPYVRAAVETTMQVHHSEPAGHILVFLTGQHEIEDACSQIRRLYHEDHHDRRDDRMEMRVLPLYGALSGRTQRDIFQPVPAHVRKVIVATNIAETSLTIDGIRYVIDCGFTKQKAFNPDKQIESLIVVPISKVSAQQRAGRAGRTAPGKCFRLYSKSSYDEMLNETIPEIQRTNLATTVLYLKVLGIHNVLHFQFLDPPAEDLLFDALHQLFVLDAIDPQGHVTTMGKLMAQFPLEPKLSRALIEGIALGCGQDMAAVVAMLSVENVYVQNHKDSKKKEQADDRNEPSQEHERMLRLAKEDLVDSYGDQLTYLKLLRAFEPQLQKQKQQKWCEERGLQFRALSTATSIKQQLLDIIAALPDSEIQMLRRDPAITKYDTRSKATRLRRAVCAGFFLHAVRRCTAQSSVYRPLEMVRDASGNGSASGVQLMHLHPLSTLQYTAAPSCCVYQELVATSRPYMRDVLQVDEQWVHDFARGKNDLSTAHLYALSGVAMAMTDKQKDGSNAAGASTAGSGAGAPSTTSTEAPTNKDDAVAAARARFLARKHNNQV